ncbi:MAG: Lrp/AsnC family transcriptional regulator [Alphaproteobacteria bacterium]
MNDSSAFSNLDRVDRKILRLLQHNGRITNAELASKVNVSPATCHRRTQCLFKDGYVRGAFEKAIIELPSILDCHLVAGDFDYFLKIRVQDIADFNRLHAEQLIALPGVRQTRTFFVMKEIIDNAPLEF